MDHRRYLFFKEVVSIKQRRLFCQINPLCYNISVGKERLLRDVSDALSKQHFALERSRERQNHILKSHRSLMLRQLDGVDMQLQRNKVVNLGIGASKLDGVLIRPGETFSFWHLVGKTGRREGYQPGLILTNGSTSAGVGGGLCQLANLIHWLVLHSPMEVTELHHHSDSIFPDSGRRVPFGTGTSVFYKHVDYRFYNPTEDTFQLHLWLEGDDLCGELRSDSLCPLRYRIEEEDHHFSCEDGVYYRNSRIYRKITDRSTHQVVVRELILQNHSRVLYDPALIPPDQIRGAAE